MGVSLFTGRMKVFLLISVAGARLVSPWNVIQKQIHTYTHTLIENENFVAFSEYHRHTVESCKEFPPESDRATCAVQLKLGCGIRCRLLSRPEGLGPEIALKSPEENKRALLALNGEPQGLFSIFYFTYFGFKVSGHGILIEGAKCKSQSVGFNRLRHANQVLGNHFKA